MERLRAIPASGPLVVRMEALPVQHVTPAAEVRRVGDAPSAPLDQAVPGLSAPTG